MCIEFDIRRLETKNEKRILNEIKEQLSIYQFNYAFERAKAALEEIGLENIPMFKNEITTCESK